MQQDFTQRFAILVRRDIEPWQAMNTLGHIAAKLGRDVVQFDTGDSFTTNDGVLLPRNSQYPVIVFAAPSDAALHVFYGAVRESGLPHLAFIREMLEFTDDDQMQEVVATKNEVDIEYLGIGVFGPNDRLKELTKKFSLWK